MAPDGPSSPAAGDNADAGGDSKAGEPAFEVLFVCTGNICRSPTAEALLRRHVEARSLPTLVRSAGTAAGWSSPTAGTIRAAAELGLDVSRHRSHPLSTEDLESAGLVVALAREHLDEAIWMSPDALPRTFTLKELVRCASVVGARSAGEELSAWVARVHAGRSGAVRATAPDDDVADPIGGTPDAYARTAAEIDGLVDELFRLAWPDA